MKGGIYLYNDLNLRKFVIPEFVFGLNARNLVGKYARNIGAVKALVVSDSGIVDAGWVDEILDDLNKYNIKTVTFKNIHPNPRDFEVMEGARVFKEENCNIIIAVGGGSPMDCAKAIGIVNSNNKEIRFFEGVDNVELPAPPVICIPTTSGSSADVSQFAIIVDTIRKVKFAIVSKTLVPDIALIDPVVLSTLPPYLIACTGMDALTHAIEAYVSVAQSAISDVHALESIKLLSSYLVQATEDRDNIKLLGKVMLGSLHAGLAFSNASLGAVHAMAHSLGGFLDLPHGECNSVLLGHIINYNYNWASDRYENICEVMGISRPKASKTMKKDLLLEKIRDLNEKLKIRKDFKSFSLSIKDISKLSENAMNDCCMVTNPRAPQIKEIEAIYGQVL